jgi:Rrf2 family iron-sulfur cluster assembly transcriptional regulator
MTHDLWSALNKKIYEYLHSVSLADLAAKQLARESQKIVIQDKRPGADPADGSHKREAVPV